MDTLRTADPRASYLALKPEIDAAIAAVLGGSDWILGPTVERFERDFARYVGASYGVGVASGTDALHLALRGLGLGPGDEVVTASHTAVATVAAIGMSGAIPVLVDVERDWRTLDPAAVEAALSPRTRAVVAVHLYGQPANLDALAALCARRKLLLVEDCAQAHGASWNGARVGTRGAAAAFSFYPTKNLGAAGDAGMVITSDDALARRVGSLRQYGWSGSRESAELGVNSRLDALQAAILSVKLPHLDAWNARRRALAARYERGLHDLPLRLPRERPGSIGAFHLYVVETHERDALAAALREAGIVAGIHYPAAVHQQPAYTGLRRGPLPVTEELAATVLSLPLYPELGDAALDRVVAAVRSFFGARA